MSYRSPKTIVKDSPIQGRGLFAAAPIGAGEIVAVKGGHIFTKETLERVQEALGPAEIQIGEDLFIGPLDASEREGSMIFSNHSCGPNLGVAGQVIFVALRDIEAGEELRGHPRPGQVRLVEVDTGRGLVTGFAEVVDNANLVTPLHQLAADLAADEAGATGHDHALAQTGISNLTMIASV